MSSLYPAVIDSSLNLPTVQDNFTDVRGSTVNRLRDAIVNIETELGVKPSGVNGTVRGRLDTLELLVGAAVPFSGDLSGNFPNITVIKIQTRSVSATAPTDGQALMWVAAENIWKPTSPPTTVPGGSVTQIQFHDTGGVFSGDSGLVYNKTTDTLSVGGNIVIGASNPASTGFLRFQKDFTIKRRNIGNTADETFLAGSSAANSLWIGSTTSNTEFFENIILNPFLSLALKINNVNKISVDASGSSFSIPAIFNDGTYIAIGSTNPASIGDIRCRNNTTIAAFRNSTNSADMVALASDGTNTLFIGSDQFFASEVVVIRLDSVANVAIHNSGVRKLYVDSSSLTLSDGVSLTVGTTNPATTGDIRMRSGSSIKFRNFLNTADVSFISADSNSNINIGDEVNAGNLILASSGFQANRTAAFYVQNSSGSTDRFVITSTDASFYLPTIVRDSQYLQIGHTNPASVGDIRFRIGATITGRNTGNGGNFNLLNWKSGDIVRLGDEATGNSYVDITQGSAAIALTTWNGSAFVEMIKVDGSKITIKSPQTLQYTTTYGDIYNDTAEVSTTDGTITDIFTWTIQDNATTMVDISVVADQSTSASGDAYKGTIVFSRDGGTVSVISAGSVTQYGATVWTVTLDNATSTGRVRVTGNAATTVRWTVHIRRHVTRES